MLGIQINVLFLLQQGKTEEKLCASQVIQPAERKERQARQR